jgi:hypothetical protein
MKAGMNKNLAGATSIRTLCFEVEDGKAFVLRIPTPEDSIWLPPHQAQRRPPVWKAKCFMSLM